MNQTLYYNQPARCFNEGLPLGNGSLGAMLLGHPEREVIYLNHDTLWSGTHFKPQGQNKSAVFKKAQAFALNGQLAEAEQLLNTEFIGSETEYYLSAGKILVQFSPLQTPEKYCRRLNLNTAVQRVEYAGMQTTAFVTYPHKVLVYRFKSRSPFCCSVSYQNHFKQEFFYTGNTVVCLSVAPAKIQLQNKKVQYLYQISKAVGMPFAVAAQFKTNGELCQCSGGFSVQRATELTLFVTIQTGYNGFEQPFLKPQEVLKTAVQTVEAACALGYSALLKAHTADYSALFGRVSLSLGSANLEEVPTNRRLEQHFAGKPDPGLYELLFHYGRYLLIACSRPGSQPANLQGLWSPYRVAPWKSNYTININTEMNYWGAFPANLGELTEPLDRLLKRLSQTGRTTAKNYYGAPGFVAHHNTDLWGMSEPCGTSSVWAYFPGGSGWLCRHLFEKYRYTGNKSYLKNTAWPIMRQAAEFYLALLVENKNGKLIFCPATSPENTFEFGGQRLCVAQSTAMLQSIIYDLFNNCISACKALDIEPEFKAELAAKLPRLQLPQVGQNGTVLEWDADYTQVDPQHRHLSHLYALYPAELPALRQKPTFLDAAQKTLNERGNAGTGWSLSWKLNLWAALQNGNKALELMDRQLRPVREETVLDTSGRMLIDGGSYPNLLSAHPPFQIDGNFGFLSGLCSLLLQSNENGIYLLPALPDALLTGSVCGLRARGNVTVDISWKNGKLTSYKIYGSNSLPVYCKGKLIAAGGQPEGRSKTTSQSLKIATVGAPNC